MRHKAASLKPGAPAAGARQRAHRLRGGPGPGGVELSRPRPHHGRGGARKRAPQHVARDEAKRSRYESERGKDRVRGGQHHPWSAPPEAIAEAAARQVSRKGDDTRGDDQDADRDRREVQRRAGEHGEEEAGGLEDERDEDGGRRQDPDPEPPWRVSPGEPRRTPASGPLPPPAPPADGAGGPRAQE